MDDDACAPTEQVPGAEVEVGEADAAGFAGAQPEAVEQFDERAVTKRDRV